MGKAGLLLAAALLVLAGCKAGTDHASGKGDAPGATDGASGPVIAPGVTQPAAAVAGVRYPEEVRRGFVRSCVGGGSAADYCECTLAGLEAKIPYARFAEIEARVAARQPAGVEFETVWTEAMIACASKKR